MKATVSKAKKDTVTLEPAEKSKTEKRTAEDTTTKENHPSSDSLLAGARVRITSRPDSNKNHTISISGSPEQMSAALETMFSK